MPREPGQPEHPLPGQHGKPEAASLERSELGLPQERRMRDLSLKNRARRHASPKQVARDAGLPGDPTQIELAHRRLRRIIALTPCQQFGSRPPALRKGLGDRKMTNQSDAHDSKGWTLKDLATVSEKRRRQDR